MMQGTNFTLDLYVYSMQGAEVVLGMHGLQKLGRVTNDYAQQLMEFEFCHLQNFRVMYC